MPNSSAMEGGARASIRSALENARGLDDGEGFDETIIEAAGGKGGRSWGCRNNWAGERI